eukprot:m.66125 g.66125  ORF g.66125 m.66125 type:complete len:63 (+) comp14038_c0_seq6:163-351(+)
MQFDTSLTVEAIVRLITVSTFWNWLDQVDGASSRHYSSAGSEMIVDEVADILKLHVVGAYNP